MQKILFIAAFLISIQSLSGTHLVLDYSGEWEYKVDTPQGPYTGAVVLTRTASGYDGHIATGGYEYDITDLVVEGNTMSFKVSVDGFPVAIKGTFDGDTYNAVASVEGTELPFVAKRKI